MADRTITSMCIVEDETPAPVFVGRKDGSIEAYTSCDAACYGKPIVKLYGHTKAVTGILASSPEEATSCSMDGTLRQWSADREQEETKRCLKVTKLFTPLRCLIMHEGVLYTGGNDGCLHVIDGSRHSSWLGHSNALSCIAVVSEDSQYLVTGGYDNHIRVWDTKLGKTIRLLVGHQNHVKCLRVIAEGELLLSFGYDLRMKVWRFPEFGDEEEDEGTPGPGDASRHATVSFQEPGSAKSRTDRLNSAGTDGEGDGAGVKQNSNRGSAVESTDDLAADHYRAAVQGATFVKSALKSRPEQPIRQLKPVGTVEIPETPHVVVAASHKAAYCYVGASNGYIFGINVRVFSRCVLQFISRNTAKVRADTRETRHTVRLALRAIRKRCKTAVQQKQRELLRAAKKERAAKKAEERKERAAAKAAAREARAAKRALDEDEEEEEEEEDGDQDVEDEEEEDEDEEQDEEEDPLALLDDAQREEFNEYKKEEEKKRDDEIETLRKAARERSELVGQVGNATYDTTRDQFFRLNFTSYKKIGSEAVQALLALSNGTCCAAQSDCMKTVDTTPGITYL